MAVGLVSCGGGGGSGGSTPASGPQPISVSITPDSPLVQVTQAQPFSATVQNDVQSSGVTWLVSGCTGIGCGTVTILSPTSVTYTAPASKPSPSTNTLTATSFYDGTKSQSVVIAIAEVPAPLFPDDFERADGPVSGWLNSGAAGGAIVGHQLTGGGSADNFIFANTAPPPADQYAKITFVSTLNANTDIDNGGPMVRANVNGDGWLFDMMSNNPQGNSSWILFRVLSQDGTAIKNGTFGRALVPGDVVEIRAVGNVIAGYVNGIAVPGATTIDSTYPTGGFGVHLFHNSGKWDDFEGGSL